MGSKKPFQNISQRSPQNNNAVNNSGSNQNHNLGVNQSGIFARSNSNNNLMVPNINGLNEGLPVSENDIREQLPNQDLIFMEQICKSRGIGLGLQISVLLAQAISPDL